MRISANDITPGIFCKNEEYWIHYVVRDLLHVFGNVVMLDTGSKDDTIRIAKETAKSIGANLHVLCKDYGNNRDKIGNAPNVLRREIKTEWMLLVGGDEVWSQDQLLKLLSYDYPDNMQVGMTIGRNVTSINGKLQERDGFNADRLFNSTVVWHKTDYPFEGHGLQEKLDLGVVHYIPVYYWHVRHLQRSRLDDEVYFRRDKQNYFMWGGWLKELKEDWLMPHVDKYINPYLSG